LGKPSLLEQIDSVASRRGRGEVFASDQAARAAAHAIAGHRNKIRSLSFDNGTESHGYKVLEGVFPVKCHFATPCHSRERGSKESPNGLLRQSLPKGTCMKRLIRKQCDRIAHELNTRPRQRHGYKTPLEV